MSSLFCLLIKAAFDNWAQAEPVVIRQETRSKTSSVRAKEKKKGGKNLRNTNLRLISPIYRFQRVI